MHLSKDIFNRAADRIATEGWCVLQDLMPAAHTQALANECSALHTAHALQPARTGAAHTASDQRGDRTHWFSSDTPSLPQGRFSACLDELRVALNHRLLLGLVDCEAHYAVYRPGARYARHRDRLRDDDARVISALYYLNTDWRDSDGGALRLYLGDGSTQDVYPQAGKLVLFLSDAFEHEVLPATRDRMGIACWMRQQALPGMH